MNIAYRFRIYPTEEQKIFLGKTFGCCRFLYNQMLNDKIREYEKTKKMLKNTPAMYKKEYPEIREKLWKEAFWSQSFCLLTAGGAPVEVIRQYIETQGEKKY